MALRLNLGCGPLRLAGEIGMDRHRTVAVDVICDITAVPCADGSAEFVRLDHVLEHMPIGTAPRVLLEARRVLAAGGTLRVGVPDISAVMRAYLDEAGSVAEKVSVLRRVYGQQTHDGEVHRSGWDAETLTDVLTACGFVDIVVEDDAGREDDAGIVAWAVRP